MSRTYRKRIDKATPSWALQLQHFRLHHERPDAIVTKKDLAMHVSDNGYVDTLPKYFRKLTSRTRRAQVDKEIYKALNWFEYEEQCSKWNCKDNNHWGYY